MQKSLEVKTSLLGSLEQGSGGSIRAGSLTDARFEIHEELLKGLFPYLDWPKPRPVPDEASPVGESAEREAFLDDYKKWAEGGAIESTILHSKPSR